MEFVISEKKVDPKAIQEAVQAYNETSKEFLEMEKQVNAKETVETFVKLYKQYECLLRVTSNLRALTALVGSKMLESTAKKFEGEQATVIVEVEQRMPSMDTLSKVLNPEQLHGVRLVSCGPLERPTERALTQALSPDMSRQAMALRERVARVLITPK
jgi:hypothetical protein